MKNIPSYILRYIPFTEEFNRYVMERLPKEDRIIFLIMLLLFATILLGFVFDVSTQMMVIILGAYLVIIVYLLKREKKPTQD